MSQSVLKLSTPSTARLKPRELLNFPWASPRTDVSWKRIPQISVIMPVYNHARFLPDSVNAVLSQEGCELELIVVDDGSEDELLDTLSPYLKDPRVKLIRQENQGLPRALNRGYAQAQGSFIAWQAADNILFPGALNKLATFLIANPSVGVAYANVQLIDDSGRALHGSNYRLPDQHPQDSSLLLLPTSGNTLHDFADNSVNCCSLIRREVLDLVGSHNPNLLGTEDYDYWLRCSLFTRIAHVDCEEPLGKYRLHEDSLTAKLDAAKLRAVTEKLAQEMCVRKGELKHLSQCEAYVGAGTLKSDLRKLKATLQSNLDIQISLNTEDLKSALISHQRFGDAFIGRPNGFPEEIKYTHSSHKALYGNLDFSPLLLVRPEQRGDALSRLLPSTWLCPSITLSSLLTRARDANFRAVQANEDSLGSILIFCPDQSEQPRLNNNFVKTLSGIISDNANFTFALLCQNEKQRLIADSVNLALKRNDNLRIVDITRENSMNPTGVDFTSIMYVLSSIDLILNPGYEQPSLSRAMELRCEAAYAAAAGVNLLVLENLAAQTSNEKDSTRVTEWSIFGNMLLEAPHIQILEHGTVKNRLNSLMKAMCRERTRLNSLEQWLETLLPEYTCKRLKTVLLSGPENIVD